MLFDHSDYRDILSDFYAMKAELNPRYSMNAYARSIGLYPSHLNEVLNRKKGLSREKALKISEALKLKDNEKDYFLELVESEHAKSKSHRLSAKRKLEQLRSQKLFTLNLNSFYVIKDWYHLALVRYLELKEKPKSISEMAKYFGIPYSKAHKAVQRLVQLKLIKKSHKGFEIDSDKWYISPYTVPSECKRLHHKQLIEKALHSLAIHPPQTRDFQSSIIKINKENLEKARPIIQKFHQDLSALLNENNNSQTDDEIFSFCTQLFSLKEETNEQSGQ